MNVRNFLNSNMKDEPNCHDGQGILKHISLFDDEDFSSKLRFINYTILPAGTSIGLHTHSNDEEIYMILEGQGLMTVDDESKQVQQGDVIVNKTFGSHELINNSSDDLKILVFEVGI
ncbi:MULTISPECIES: cupin domain-containing protein [unclassified Clostridium]|uniref:cupin domain-containing protein n=1 Tax=unclassified Clostridium TaxID=2614128 RepID=UPI000297932D|nr:MULTISPECIES: cupin domain-containing protein [unclassified Clostridium]EKQ56501.1 MAG: cupin domain-containing protein [Clostridium sp. Maddingley MBC34-26]